MEHGTHLTAGEGSERPFLCDTFTLKLCQELAQARIRLITTVSQHDKQRGSNRPPCQIMEKIQAVVVAPMHVLDDQQKRLFGGRSDDPSCHCLKEATFL